MNTNGAVNLVRVALAGAVVLWLYRRLRAHHRAERSAEEQAHRAAQP